MAEVWVKGIDVSHYQGVIDWSAVSKSGIEFAFIKSTDGVAKTDPMFCRNWQAARDNGIRRGAYHFFRAEQDPERQAQLFLAMLKGEWGELPPVLDFELSGGVSNEEGLSRAKTWMIEVKEATGLKPILYTGPAFWRSTMKDACNFGNFPLWIAHYTAAPEPSLPRAWNRWAFWQHSEKGTVPGINGPVDLDLFNGNLMELDHLCGRITSKSAIAGS